MSEHCCCYTLSTLFLTSSTEKFQSLFSLQEAVLYLNIAPVLSLPYTYRYKITILFSLFSWAMQNCASHDAPHASVCMAYLYSTCLFMKPLQSLWDFYVQNQTLLFSSHETSAWQVTNLQIRFGANLTRIKQFLYHLLLVNQGHIKEII